MFDDNRLSVVELVAVCAVDKAADRASRAALGIVLDVMHVGREAVHAELRRGASELADAAGIRSELRAQVREVLLRIAGRVAALAEQASQERLVEDAVADDARRRNQHAFLVDVTAARGHRARRQAADVRMVRTRGREEPGAASRVVEHRRHDREVRQVRASVVRRIDQERITWPQIIAVRGDYGSNACTHRTEVYGHVRCVGYELCRSVEDRAREVEPLLDVDRAGRLLEHYAHLLGDVHEEAVHHLEAGRIGTFAGAGREPRRGGLSQHQVAVLGQ